MCVCYELSPCSAVSVPLCLTLCSGSLVQVDNRQRPGSEAKERTGQQAAWFIGTHCIIQHTALHKATVHHTASHRAIAEDSIWSLNLWDVLDSLILSISFHFQCWDCFLSRGHVFSLDALICIFVPPYFWMLSSKTHLEKKGEKHRIGQENKVMSNC